MNLKSLLIASVFVGASSLGASAATINPDDFMFDGKVTSGNCPFGGSTCILLPNNGTAELTYSGGVFDLVSFEYALQGSGSEVTATSDLGDVFVSQPLQGNNPDNTAIVNWTGVTTINFESTGNGSVRIGVIDGVVQMTAVPLPAGLPLMLVGLGALGIAKRRKAS